MRVRLWGTRGSLAAPGPDTARFGGNTACVEVRGRDGTLLVLDAGTGIRLLGAALGKHGPRRIHVLLSSRPLGRDRAAAVTLSAPDIIARDVVDLEVMP